MPHWIRTRRRPHVLRLAAALLLAGGLVYGPILLLGTTDGQLTAYLGLLAIEVGIAGAVVALWAKVRAAHAQRRYLSDPLEISTLSFPPASLQRSARR